MRGRNLFIFCISIVFLFTLVSIHSAEAAINDWFYPGYQCIRHGSTKDCEQSFPVGDFSYQAWQADVTTFYEGFGSAGSVRIDVCLNTSGQMWDGQCENLIIDGAGEVNKNYGTRTVTINNVNNNTGLYWYAVLHVRVEDASTDTDVIVYGRKVNIDSFSALPSQVKAGDTINVSWTTDYSFRGRTLFYGGVTQPGSSSVAEDSSATFTAGSAGTAEFTLKACGPGSGIPYTCVEQDRTVTITALPQSSPQPTGTTWSNFTTCTKSGSQKCDIVLNYNTSNATQGNINQTYNSGASVLYYDIPGAFLSAGTAPVKTDPAPGAYVYILYGANASFPSQELNRTQTITIIGEAPPPPSGNFSLAVNKSGSGIVTGPGINCGADCNENFGQGISVTLTATPDNGWTFTSWFGCDSTSGNNCTVIMNANRSVTATFIALTGCQGNCARYVFQVPPPSQMTVGETRTVSITMENTGTTTWTCCSGSSDINFSDGYKLGSQNPQDNFTWGLARDIVSKTVSPGQQETFDFNVTAPSTPNIYNFQLRMVQDIGKGWFGDLTPNVAVSVINVPPPPVQKYSCNQNNQCVADSNGPYTTSNCDNQCVASPPPPVQKYSCNQNNQCVADSNGLYTTSNCDNQCVAVPPPSVQPGTIFISAKDINTSGPINTNWTLFYNGSIVNQDSGSSMTYSNKPTGQYRLEPLAEGTSHILERLDSSPSNQFLVANGTLVYTIWYRPKSATTCQDRNATNYGGPLPCTSPAGSVTDSCTVNVSTRPAPAVSISSNPSTVTLNQSSTLLWLSSNADSCSASGDWSGSITPNVSDSRSMGNLNRVRRYSYALTCYGNGSDSKTAYVDVTAPPPSVSNVTAIQPNYCISGPATTVNWSYSDPLGSPQTAYQVQIDDQGSFGSPEVDTGKIQSGSNSYFSGQGRLQFNVTYRSRVRVWNGYDVPSGWIESGSWKTPPYAYPQVNFIWSPTNPPIDRPVQFTDQTVFGGNPNGRRWSWLFGDGGASTQQNPSKTYTTEGTYYSTLAATDNANQTCTISKGPIRVQKPIPIWKEVAPR